jgi:hypothetical protein
VARGIDVAEGTIARLVVDADELRGVQLGDGSAAAIAVNANLVHDDVRVSVRELAHGLVP